MIDWFFGLVSLLTHRGHLIYYFIKVKQDILDTRATRDVEAAEKVPLPLPIWSTNTSSYPTHQVEAPVPLQHPCDQRLGEMCDYIDLNESGPLGSRLWLAPLGTFPGTTFNGSDNNILLLLNPHDFGL